MKLGQIGMVSQKCGQSIKIEQRILEFHCSFFYYYVSVKPTGKICALSSCYAVVQLMIAASYSFSSS